MREKRSGYLGEFEEIVLLAVARLENNAYGVTIRQTVEEVAGRPTSIGAIYTTLDRLEQKGYISSCVSEATAKRGGRAKRYFELENAGREAMNEVERVRDRIRHGLNTRPISGAEAVAYWKQTGVLGAWANRTDITDSAEYARQLRQQAQTRNFS